MKYKYTLYNELAGTSFELTLNPNGWDSLEETFTRHDVYNGIFYSESSNQIFVNKGLNDEGGYDYVWSAYEADGIKARVRLERKKYNNFTLQYEPHFVGYLDYNPISGFNKTDDGIEFKVIDSSKLSKFFARDEIEYDLFSLVSADGITVSDFPNIPSTSYFFSPIDINLFLQANGTTQGSGTSGNLIFFTFLSGTKTTNEIGDRITIENPTAGRVIYNNTTSETTYLTNSIIKGILNYTATVTISSQLNLALYIDTYDENDNRITYAYIQIRTVTFTGTKSETYPFSFPDGIPLVIREYPSNVVVDSFEVPANGYARFAILNQLTNSSSSGSISVNHTITELSFYEQSNGYPENAIFGLMIHNALERSLQLVTSETDTTKILNANILGFGGATGGNQFRTYPSDGDFAKEFLTNGFFLRRFTDKALNASFRDLFKAMNYVNPLMLHYDRVNDYFVIDDISQSFKMEAYSTNLGQVKDLKTYPAKEFYFNQILSGYDKTDNEEFSGANEVCTETEHALSYEVKTKKELRSSIKRSSIDIEQLRRKNISLYESEDTKNDKQNYLVTVDNGNHVQQGGLANASGIVNIDQYYNLLRTPRQNLLRWMKVLKATMFKHSTEVVKFISSYKDSDISYTDPITGLSVTENSNISQTTDEPLFWPEIDEFEGVYSDDVRNELYADPYKYWEYYDRDGNLRRGFNFEVTGNLETQKGQFKLLRINDNLL